jgi:DNA polymerase-1
VLFEDLGLRPGRKKKTGFSTDVGVLEGLAAAHPLPAEVLQWRTLAKLKNTYVDVLPRLVNPATGRVHTSFNQCVTATGRLSSSEPNLQNIPVRGEWGTRVRSCFIAPEGSALISADYSQIELRVLAHLSRDEALVEAFRTDTDIHALTASEIFGVDVARVDAEMRRAAKTVNFGVLYGMSAFGLSESLGITRAEAERYIAQYFAAHPGVSALFERIIAEAAGTGMARTMFGRMRPVPELKAKNRAIRQQGERIAVNTTVQGTAADIIKLAMVRIDRALHDQKMNARMILQVHDELLVEAPEAEVEGARAAVEAGMCGAADLRVPLKIAMGHGRNWAEAH